MPCRPCQEKVDVATAVHEIWPLERIGKWVRIPCIIVLDEYRSQKKKKKKKKIKKYIKKIKKR